MAAVVRDRDVDAVRACLRALRSRVDVPVLFGGAVGRDGVTLTELFGTRTAALRGLIVRPGEGLGGRALVEGRPLAVSDYRTARSITHEYDRPVLNEGITSLLALPVSVLGRTRSILYLGTRDGAVDEQLARVARPVVDELAAEIRIRDEVERRVAVAEAPREDLTAAELGSLREIQAELRAIAATVEDPVLLARLRAIEERLTPADRETRVLTPREVDVLALVALGYRNAEIAEHLRLGVETVRSYLKNAMRKLDASTRLQAVAQARLRGELL